MIKGLFEAIDRKNVTSFCNFLTPDCTFRFGNGEPVSGKDNIEHYVAGFLDSIEGLSHDIADTWDVPDGKICHGTVTYIRKDSSTLECTVLNRLKGGKWGISEYLIFADISDLYS